MTHYWHPPPSGQGISRTAREGTLGAFASATSTATGLWPGYPYTITVTAYSLNGTPGALSTKSMDDGGNRRRAVGPALLPPEGA